MKRPLQLLLLRLLLAGAGLGWAVSVIGVVLPWPTAVDWLQRFGGAGPIPDDPMAQYWLRMASGAFTLVGAIFLACAWRPQAFAPLVVLLAVLSLAQGFMLLGVGLWLRLAPMPFAADVAICLVPGVGIMLMRGALKPGPGASPPDRPA
jgi:hypothetical protein